MVVPSLTLSLLGSQTPPKLATRNEVQARRCKMEGTGRRGQSAHVLSRSEGHGQCPPRFPSPRYICDFNSVICRRSWDSTLSRVTR